MAGEAPPDREGRESIDWIVIAKGLGIILVVVGHFDPDTAPAFWVALRKVIYGFHMPLFFLLSGFLYDENKYSYPQLILNKVKRLVYPFLTIAGSYFVLKYAAGLVMHVEYPVDADSIRALLVDPVDSYVPLLWFIHALFLVFVLYPIARLFLSDLSIFLLCLAFEEVAGNRFPVIGKVLVFLPFFAVGILLRKSREGFGGTRGTLAAFPIEALLFAGGCAVVLTRGEDVVHAYTFLCLIGVMGALVCIDISRLIASGAAGWLRDSLLEIGRYSMTIYLLHPLFVGAVRAGAGRLGPHLPFGVVAATAIAAGVLVPMALERRVLRQFALTRTLVLGLG